MEATSFETIAALVSSTNELAILSTFAMYAWERKSSVRQILDKEKTSSASSNADSADERFAGGSEIWSALVALASGSFRNSVTLKRASIGSSESSIALRNSAMISPAEMMDG